MNRTKPIRLVRLFAALTIPSFALHAATPIPLNLPRPDGKPGNPAKPVKVYLLAGQSNMNGMGDLTGARPPWSSIFLSADPAIIPGSMPIGGSVLAVHGVYQSADPKAETYLLVGESMGRAMVRLLGGEAEAIPKSGREARVGAETAVQAAKPAPTADQKAASLAALKPLILGGALAAFVNNPRFQPELKSAIKGVKPVRVSPLLNDTLDEAVPPPALCCARLRRCASFPVRFAPSGPSSASPVSSPSPSCRWKQRRLFHRTANSWRCAGAMAALKSATFTPASKKPGSNTKAGLSNSVSH